MKKGEKLIWISEQQNAFEILQTKLTSVLNYPDFRQEFLVIINALDYAIGAVLLQGRPG